MKEREGEGKRRLETNISITGETSISIGDKNSTYVVNVSIYNQESTHVDRILISYRLMSVYITDRGMNHLLCAHG